MTEHLSPDSTFEAVHREFQVAPEAFGQRIDAFLASQIPEYSRVRLQEWLKQGCVTLNGKVVDKPREKLMGGEQVVLNAKLEVQIEDKAEDLGLAIVYEDEALLIINKPVGLVVHPAPGHRAGTLVNALLHHAPELKMLPRAGLIHRIDKDTSGLLVVARTPETHTLLVRALSERAFLREYDAIVHGLVIAGGSVDAPIGRDPGNRQQMAVVEGTGREALTHYRVVERFRAHSHIKCRLETGRTHQIRVHMGHAGFPLLGDPVYGGRRKMLAKAEPDLVNALNQFRRQALHATRLGLQHPLTGEMLQWESPLPEDMSALMALLRADRDQNDY